MILRRPYAFLIKHFRIIHLILFALFGYITYKASDILSFFKEYIKNNGNLVFNSNEYISYFIFVAIIFIVMISIIVFLLMRYKKKPKLFYIIIGIISIVSGILFVYLHNNIKILEISVVSSRQVRLLRDISNINFWILLITCIPVLIRGLGFDIKKFNFSSDLHELKLDEADNEEVEINIDLSSDGVKRTGRKFLRELKYYYFENKFILNIIFSVVGVVLILVFPFNRYIIKGDLKERQTLGTNYFNIKINDSFISNKNRTSKENSYVILKISVIGKIEKYKIDLDEFILSSKKNDYLPSLKYYYYFEDIGRGYKNNVLSTNEYNDYILVYNIKTTDKDNKLTFKYLGSDRKINISPQILD